MAESRADALVFFGATGDLAYEQIFPALQALAGRGDLDVPVIGVAKDDWTPDQLRTRARESVTAHGGSQTDAFAKLAGRLSYSLATTPRPTRSHVWASRSAAPPGRFSIWQSRPARSVPRLRRTTPWVMYVIC